LYYTDSYLREFRARVTDRAEEGRRIYLDRTAFYPDSGGQPHDAGSINGVAVTGVDDEGERIAHVMAAPVESGDAECCIDWQRRFDHMQQHSGQHCLSAVFIERFAAPTVSFHLGQENCTIDLETAALDAAQVSEAEAAANQVVFEDRPVTVSFEEAGAVALRKPSERTGTLRIVTIEGLDRSACGGTHVRRTGEIGPILIRKLEKVRNTVRVEFVCGGRAVRRARADYDALARLARQFSGALDEVPDLVAAQMEAARAGDKLRRKLESDLAGYQGRELYATAEPGSDGLRRVTRQVRSGGLDGLRELAQSFTAQPGALFVAVVEEPPSVLLAVSADSSVDAGKVLGAVLRGAGGRGGGNARFAQGGVPNRETLNAVIEQIKKF
jgi:alanyl-tRNA synthetase